MYHVAWKDSFTMPASNAKKATRAWANATESSWTPCPFPVRSLLVLPLRPVVAWRFFLLACFWKVWPDFMRSSICHPPKKIPKDPKRVLLPLSDDSFSSQIYTNISHIQKTYIQIVFDLLASWCLTATKIFFAATFFSFKASRAKPCWSTWTTAWWTGTLSSSAASPRWPSCRRRTWRSACASDPSLKSRRLEPGGEPDPQKKHKKNRAMFWKIRCLWNLWKWWTIWEVFSGDQGYDKMQRSNVALLKPDMFNDVEHGHGANFSKPRKNPTERKGNGRRTLKLQTGSWCWTWSLRQVWCYDAGSWLRNNQVTPSCKKYFYCSRDNEMIKHMGLCNCSFLCPSSFRHAWNPISFLALATCHSTI